MLICCAGLFSCKEDKLDVYTSPSSIYFDGTIVSGRFLPQDSLVFSFGYVPVSVQDTVLKIPVRVTGSVSNDDRPYRLILSEEGTLREGIDFDFESKDFAIQAGELTDTIHVRVQRSVIMKSDTLHLKLKLEENTNFKIQMESQLVGSGDFATLRYFNKFDLRIDDVVGVPWFWDPTRNRYATATISYLGNYSAKKFQLLISRFELDVAVVTQEKMPSTLIAWAQGMQAYLNEMTSNGTPVLEDDGTPMKMGQYAQ